MRISTMLALAGLAALALLPGCMLFNYDDLEPGARSQAAVAAVHAQELRALAEEIHDGVAVTGDQVERLQASAEEAEDLRDLTREFHRLVSGEAAGEEGDQ